MLKYPNHLPVLRHKIMVCPKSVKYVAVSTTINPVTQTALVEVNKASTNEIPPTVAIGAIKSNGTK